MAKADWQNEIAPEDFAMRLRLARVARRVSQKELALSLGVEPQTVWNWENGKTVPTGKARARLVDKFGSALFRSGLEAPPFEGRETLPQHPFLRTALLDHLGRMSRAGATAFQIEAARRLLSSESALDLYSNYATGAASDMERAMSLLAGAVEALAVTDNRTLRRGRKDSHR